MTLSERLRTALDTASPTAPDMLTGDLSALDLDGARPDTEAAVLIAVTDRAEPGILLTRRADTLSNHAGQVAFPGGRIDSGDDGPIAAALREAQEEIGLPPRLVEVIGAIDRYRTITRFAVTPVLGVVPPDLPLVPAEAEVAAVFEAPLAFVLDPANQIETTRIWQGRARRYYQIDWRDHRIWGATAAMLVNLSRRLAWHG